MKAIRIALLGVAIVAASSAVASAQAPAAPAPQQQGGPGARGGRGNMAMNGIELTDEQKAKQAEIAKKYAPEMTALQESMQNGGDRAELMKKSMELRDKRNADIRAILTTEQQAVFDRNLADQKAAMEARMRQAPPGI